MSHMNTDQPTHPTQERHTPRVKTKASIYDSLFYYPITKAALFGYIALSEKACRCRSTESELRQMYVSRADSIADRFRIRSLVLEFRAAA